MVSASSYPSSGALQQRSSEEKQPDIVYKITPPTVADVDEGQLQTIERLLEEEEEVLKGLSQRQKYEVYERAKAAIEHKVSERTRETHLLSVPTVPHGAGRHVAHCVMQVPNSSTPSD